MVKNALAVVIMQSQCISIITSGQIGIYLLSDIECPVADSVRPRSYTPLGMDYRDSFGTKSSFSFSSQT